jgi:hypothetical protein
LELKIKMQHDAVNKKLIEDKNKRKPAKTIFEKKIKKNADKINNLINSIEEINDSMKDEIEDTFMEMNDL